MGIRPSYRGIREGDSAVVRVAGVMSSHFLADRLATCAVPQACGAAVPASVEACLAVAWVALLATWVPSAGRFPIGVVATAAAVPSILAAVVAVDGWVDHLHPLQLLRIGAGLPALPAVVVLPFVGVVGGAHGSRSSSQAALEAFHWVDRLGDTFPLVVEGVADRDPRPVVDSRTVAVAVDRVATCNQLELALQTALPEAVVAHRMAGGNEPLVVEDKDAEADGTIRLAPSARPPFVVCLLYLH